MVNYIVTRVFAAILALVLIISINFYLIYLLHDTILYKLSDQALINTPKGLKFVPSSNSIAHLKQYLGVDQPFVLQYFKVLKSYLTFDLGNSWFFNNSVINLIVTSLKMSMPISFFSTVATYILAFYIGFLQSYFSNYFIKFLSWSINLFYVIPTFVLSFLVAFFVKSPNLIWSIAILVLSNLLFTVLLARFLFAEQIKSTYITLLKVNGTNSLVILHKHLLPNVIFGVLADFPMIFLGMIFGSSIFVEVILNIQGFAWLNYNAIIVNDYPVVLGSIYIIALVSVLMRIVGDILYIKFDKRVKIHA